MHETIWRKTYKKVQENFQESVYTGMEVRRKNKC